MSQPTEDSSGSETTGCTPPPPAPAPTQAAEGSLFLTCLRLRYEQAGDWETALADPAERRAVEEEEDAAGSDSSSSDEDHAPGTPSTCSGGSAPRFSWKKWAGRERGSDKYRLGDVTRGSVRKFKEKARQTRQDIHKSRKLCFGAAGAGLELRQDPADASIETVVAVKADRYEAFAPVIRTINATSGQALIQDAKQEVDAVPCCVVTTFAPLRRLRAFEKRRSPGGAAEALGRTHAANSADGDIAKGIGAIKMVARRVRRYYFEFRVLALTPGHRGTFSVGFCWGVPDLSGLAAVQEAADQEEPAPSPRPSPPRAPLSAQEALTAAKLPCSLIMGGDPPHAYLDGVDIGKVAPWRPALHTAECSVVGALLEIYKAGDQFSLPSMCFTIFQDGEEQVQVHEQLTTPDQQRRARLHPYGVIDLGGHLRAVQLLSPGGPPAALSVPVPPLN